METGAKMTIEIDDSKLQSILNHQREHWGNVVSELIDGEKLTHWCWYFLPNVPGLGQSEQSQYFAVELNEFARYMENSEYRGNICTVIHLIDRAYRESDDMDLKHILGEVDALKFRSFLTLFRMYYWYIAPGGLLNHCHGTTKLVKYSDDVYGTCDFTRDYILGNK
jgi:uncharacterized protein (DUF1810 family)